MTTEPKHYRDPRLADELAGINEGMKEDYYHAQTWAVSNSDLKVFGGDSPAHYLAKLNGADEDDSALTEDEKKTRVMGKLSHLSVLEPARFGRDKSHYVKPLIYVDEKGTEKAWNGNATICKAWIEQHSDKPVINEKEEKRLIGATKAILSHPVAGDLVSGTGSNEASIFVTHPKTGLRLRMRADRLTEDAEGRPWCVDLKSCPNVDRFVWTARDFRYDVQCAFYSDVLALAGIENAAFCFVAFELAPRFGIHAVRVVMPDHDTIVAARSRYEWELVRLAECRAKDHWPLGNEEIEFLTVKRFNP